MQWQGLETIPQPNNKEKKLKLEFDIRDIEQLVIAKAVAIGIHANACSITTRNGHFEKAVAWFDAQPENDAADLATGDWVTVPETTLPDGRVVPTFKYAKYPCSKGADRSISLDASAKPWVNIKFADAVSACQAAGYQLTRETQELAIRLNVSQQDINWTGGKVGEGKIYQGIHKGNMSSAQAADYVSDDPEERSWHQLSNGERVYGLAGNVYTWVFDDVQGNDRGIIAGRIAKDSISLTTAPYPSQQKGMGWRPDGDTSWSGYALVRGGCWRSGDNAGVFRLDYDWPDYDISGVGFRCTKP